MPEAATGHGGLAETATTPLPAEERQELQAVLDAFLDDLYPWQQTRDLPPDAGTDRARWRRLARELDVLSLRVPAELGGQDLSFAHTVLVAERIGRHLAPVPHLAVAGLVIPLILRLGSQRQRQRWLPGLIGGDVIGAFVTTGRRGPLPPDAGAGSPGAADGVTATAHDTDRQLLNGTVPFVLHGADADILLVEAVEPSGSGVFLVEAGADGLDTQPMRVLDPSRPQTRVTFHSTPARRLGAAQPHRPHVDHVLTEALILLGAEAAGAASSALDLAVDYTGVRQQFGRPVGSFQAIQHLLADLCGELETARACVDWATTAVDQAAEPTATTHAASVVKVRTTAALEQIARQSLHVHGGIGFTWEHHSHLYLKRALGDRSVLGTPEDHRRAIAAALSGPQAT